MDGRKKRKSNYNKIVMVVGWAKLQKEENLLLCC